MITRRKLILNTAAVAGSGLVLPVTRLWGQGIS